MMIELKERTAKTVLTYFRATRDAEIQKFFPQKAQSEEEALADFEKTQREGATSYGRTIYADGRHVGDIWCYCIQEEEPNAMVSYCVFEKTLWNRGVATRSLKLFLEEIIEKFHLKHIGAFTCLENISSIRVLEANGFCRMEEFTEDGVTSVYLQKTRMTMITKSQYLTNPCAAASIPFWKAKTITVPEGMLILHHTEFDAEKYTEYVDEPYFRLYHDLQGLSAPVLPDGFSICNATLEDFVLHINGCYHDIGVSAEELRRYTEHPVYHPALWLAIRDDRTGELVASGIAELDREIGEGILEWIQVSKEYRGCGLGSFVVSELLWRMKDIAKFVTVSGQCDNPTNPETLYRRCGFKGNDVWHILRKAV